jgi:precorrin-6x reductase
MINGGIALFAGTTEGREICEYCIQHNIGLSVYVATEYGKEVLPTNDNLSVFVGRMEQADMERELAKKNPALVIDATHPYAVLVTENIANACKTLEIPYIRVSREKDNCKAYGGNIYYVKDTEEAAKILAKWQNKKILLTTGSKDFLAYTKLKDWQQRVYLRILPSVEQLSKCLEAGFSSSHLICMQGPFSKEMNSALIKQFGIDVMVTKESGNTGGFLEKIEAANENLIPVLVLKRPQDFKGKSVAETIGEIVRLNGKTDIQEKEN